MLEAERKAVGSHGSFAWSTDPYHAVHNSAVPEELAFMAFRTEAMPPRHLSHAAGFAGQALPV